MIIQDVRFASAFVTDNGEVLKFDDIGCMSSYLGKHTIQTRHRWVHDFDSQQWADAEKVCFVRAQSIETPMGYGAAAFLSQQSTKNFLEKEKGVQVPFDAIYKIVSDHSGLNTGGNNE